ncbi:SgcJ/EcaC family oxidoreductase [Specibacter cremeus]|uniref:SgcJ/EcaC family oxidoreductase n=1 Tax=Specibacter cremeus TaxID=1629051 RepID=UPI000F78BCB2|nr:SgcJ/EcaC family oxidoreductase [Specibacter cremeus]
MTIQDDREAITAVLAEMNDAWARHDADAYGALFTEDATYVTFVGTHYSGRADIVACHRTLFSKFLKNTRLAADIIDIRFPGPDTAIVTGRGDTYKGASAPAPSKMSKVQTHTLVREADGTWLIAAFHNTQRKRLMEAISFKTAPSTIPAAQK